MPKHTSDTRAWKASYFEKLENCMRNYQKFLLVSADNVSSLQFAEIRQAIRGKAQILMGKNTMMKRCINNLKDEFPEYDAVIPRLKGNVGFVFTNLDLKEIRDLLLANQKEAPARAGAISPIDVIVPPQNTGCGPEKTSFFQALQIQTRIARGTVEIANPVHLLKPGVKVGQSEATLLQMLKIFPFHYGLEVECCFDEGTVFDAEVLDITPDDIRAKFLQGVNSLAAVSLNIGYPTVVSAPHSIANAMKKLLAVAAATDITFKEAEAIKDRLANPDAYAVEVVEEAVVETEAAAPEDDDDDDSSDDDMGFGALF